MCIRDSSATVLYFAYDKAVQVVYGIVPFITAMDIDPYIWLLYLAYIAAVSYTHLDVYKRQVMVYVTRLVQESTRKKAAEKERMAASALLTCCLLYTSF